MAVGCGATCAKVILITFNFLFWLTGIALLVLGIWICADDNIEQSLKLVEDPSSGVIITKYLAYALIAIGGLVFVIGFLGCCGALKENRCLIGLYVFFLVIIAGAEIAAGVLGFIHKNQLEEKVNETFKKKWEMYKNNTDPADVVTAAINHVQAKMNCCGPDGKERHDPKLHHGCDAKQETQSGCIQALKDWITKCAPVLIGVACGFGGLEILGIICAFCLCRAVGEKDD